MTDLTFTTIWLDEDKPIDPALARRVAADLAAAINRRLFGDEPARTFLVTDPERRDTWYAVTTKNIS